MDDEPITDAEQQRAATLMSATEEIVAPASLHAAVHAMTSDASRRRSVTRPRWVLSGAALAAVIVALVIVLGGGGGNAPTVGQAARLALAPATGGAPAQDVSDRSLLNVSQSGIAFPSYINHDGWSPTGVRRDTLAGRHVTTVFYRSPGGARVGYAIVSGKVLSNPTGATTSMAGDVRYFVTRSGGARTVSWWRDGHTCVISGRSVSAATLLSLAQADEQTA